MSNKKRIDHLVPLAALLAITAALLFVAFFHSRPWTLEIGSPGDTPYIENFFLPEPGPEGIVRWSSPGSELVLHGASARVQALNLKIYGDEDYQSFDRPLDIQQHGESLATFDIRDGWRTYRVLLPASTLVDGSGEPEPLDLVMDPFYREQRSLGAPVDRVRLVPMTQAPVPLGVPLVRSLLLTWLLAGLAGVLWTVDRRLIRSPAPQDTDTRPRTLRVGVVTGIVGLVLVAWVWRSPETLALVLPPPLWTVVPGAVLLLMPLWVAWPFGDHSPEQPLGASSPLSLDGSRGQGRESDTVVAKRQIFIGLFLVALATLLYENLLTRIFSISMWYHFAFIAISVAMFGMTVGALLVYLRPRIFTPERVQYHLALYALLFSLVTVLSFLTHLSIPFSTDPFFLESVVGIYTIALTYAIIAVPFLFSGVCITLALTKFPRQVSRLYAADLAGAAIGCIMVIATLRVTDGPTAVLIVAALAALAAVFFAAKGEMKRLYTASLVVCVLFISLAAYNTVLVNRQASPFRLVWARGNREPEYLYKKWNSFSRVAVTGSPYEWQYPQGWGMSRAYPGDEVRQLEMSVDAGAGTYMTAFHGDLEDIEYLKYDVTNVAHYLRSDATVLVAGVGGGRDLLSALAFEQQSVMGVEINEDIIHAVNDVFGNFTGYLDKNPRVTFVNDEARSYIARQQEQFDIIQVSLIDTWAATTAGAFVFTENALYTVDAWEMFLGQLSPRGILTFSRWYFWDRPGEMYRLTSLATAALMETGIEEPRNHIMIVRRMYSAEAVQGVGTILVSKEPFTAQDIDTLEAVAAEMGFEIMLSPRVSPEPVFAEIASGDNYAEYTARFPLDITPPTDDNPFFFQMLRLRDIFDKDLADQGTISFNLHAVRILGLLILVVLVLTFLCIIVPLLLTTRKEHLKGTLPLFLFFACIGLGFMLIEISHMQRLIIFLGHPTYSLSVVLFTLLLASGLGSSLTERIRYDQSAATGRMIFGLLLVVLALSGLLTPVITDLFETAVTPLRVLVAVVMLFPMGVGMGTAFPLGMQIAANRAALLTPWLWGINGAMSVCASVFSVAIALASSISTSFWTGFLCYIGAGLSFVWAHHRARQS